MARYKEAIEWIARFDPEANADDDTKTFNLLTVHLVASLWGKRTDEVVADVQRQIVKDAAFQKLMDEQSQEMERNEVAGSWSEWWSSVPT